MQHYTTDVSQPDNRVSEADYRSNMAQCDAAANEGFHDQERTQLKNMVASTSRDAQRYEDNHHHRQSVYANSYSSGNTSKYYAIPTLVQHEYANTNNLSENIYSNETSCSENWNKHSGSRRDCYQLVDDSYDVTQDLNPIPQSQSTSAYLNTRTESFPMNQQDVGYNSDAVPNNLSLDINSGSSSYNNMRSNSILTDQLGNIPNYGMTMTRTNQYSKQLSSETTQGYSQLHSYINDLNQNSSPQLFLSENNKMFQSQTYQPDWSQTEQLNQGFVKPFNQIYGPEMDYNKYQQMRLRQAQQWRQHHADQNQNSQGQIQQLQPNETQSTLDSNEAQPQPIHQTQTRHEQQKMTTPLHPCQQNHTDQQQNLATPFQQCQTQLLLQTQSGNNQQNWTIPLQQCQAQPIYQSTNQQLETHLTPMLKDLRFSTPARLVTENLDSPNLLEGCFTPIPTNNAYKQNVHRRKNKRDSSTRQSAQKELFQLNQPAWSDCSYPLQNASIDKVSNKCDPSNLWTREEKKNLPVCYANIHFTENSDFTKNLLAIEPARSNKLQNSTIQVPEMIENLVECNFDTRIAQAARFLSVMQEPRTTMNSGLTILDMLSAEDKVLYLQSVVNRSDSINVNSSAAAVSCASGPSQPKTPKKTFTCEICGNVFKFQSSLRAHRLRHLDPTKRYACTTCESKFSDRSALRKHLRVHTGEQPFECKICGSRFSQAGNLRRHERMTHSTTDR